LLTAESRLRSGRDFADTIRSGTRAGSSTLVVHLMPAAPATVPAPPRVGLVVSKAVGNAVTRNRVKRRLRELLRPRLSSLSGPAVLVVRALPAARTATYAELGAALDRALDRAQDRALDKSLARSTASEGDDT
jgi:ribonuclease P protein component